MYLVAVPTGLKTCENEEKYLCGTSVANVALGWAAQHCFKRRFNKELNSFEVSTDTFC